MVFFDPRSVERDSHQEPVPYGQYLCKVDKVVIKEKDSSSQGLNVFFSVLKPSEHLGKSVLSNFNLKNANAQAEKIGQQQFAKFLDLLEMGDKPLTDVRLLENKVVKLLVGLKPHYKNAGEMQNEVLKYLPFTAADLDGLAVSKSLEDEVLFDASTDVPF
jgi:hypothetical protein